MYVYIYIYIVLTPLIPHSTTGQPGVVWHPKQEELDAAPHIARRLTHVLAAPLRYQRNHVLYAADPDTLFLARGVFYVCLHESISGSFPIYSPYASVLNCPSPVSTQSCSSRRRSSRASSILRYYSILGNKETKP